MTSLLATAAQTVSYLSAEDEAALLARASQGDQRAIDRVVCAHLRMVFRLAKILKSYAEEDDLVSEGCWALCKAVSRWGAGRANRFNTYAMWWVKAVMFEYANCSGTLHVATTPERRKAMFKLSAACRELGIDTLAFDKLEPDHGDILAIAEHLDVAPADVEAALSARRVSSLNAPLGEGAGEVGDLLASAELSPEEALIRQDCARHNRSLVQTGLDHLNERERDILVERNMRETPLTLEDLGARYGVSRERIRQIEVAAKDKLRGAIVRNGLRPAFAVAG